MMGPSIDGSPSVSERVSQPAESGEPAVAADSSASERLPALVNLGRALAEAREAQAIPLAVLAEQNYISSDRLEALESGDHTRLPERIYLIAQARRVATSLGLNAEGLTEPLLNLDLPGVRRTASPSPAPVARVSLAAPAMAPLEPGSPSLLGPTPQLRRTGIGWRLAGAAGVLALAGGLAFGWKQSQPAASNPASPPVAAEASEATAISPTSQPSETAKPAQLSQGSLQLSSREPSWLEVRNGEGQELFRGLFSGSSTFSLAAGLQVLAGRPDLITLTTASGQTQTLGTIEQVRWQRFSSSGERQPSTGSSSR
jgi:cytoskeleton protein RodZ